MKNVVMNEARKEQRERRKRQNEEREGSEFFVSSLCLFHASILLHCKKAKKRTMNAPHILLLSPQLLCIILIEARVSLLRSFTCLNLIKIMERKHGVSGMMGGTRS